MKSFALASLSLLAAMAVADSVISPGPGRYLSRNIGTPGAPLSTGEIHIVLFPKFENVTLPVFGPSGNAVATDSGITPTSGWTPYGDALLPAERIFVGSGLVTPPEVPTEHSVELASYIVVVPTTLSQNSLVVQRGSVPYDLTSTGPTRDNPTMASLIDCDFGGSDRDWIGFKDPTTANQVIFAKAHRLTVANGKGCVIRIPESVTAFTGHFVTRLTKTWSTGSYTSYHVRSRTYLVERGATFVQSVDSRVAYGDPTTEGELKPDPNSPLGHVSFPNWSYGGGLFLGHGEAAPEGLGQQTTKKDKSGVARILAKPTLPSAPSGYVMSTVSLGLFDLGRPNRGNTMYSSAALLTESNSAAPLEAWPTSNLVTFNHRITPGTVPDGLPEVTLAATTTTAGPVQDILGSTSIFYMWSHKDYGTTSGKFPYIEVKLVDENTNGRWRYFSSPSFIANLNTANHPQKTFYDRTAPFAGICWESTSTQVTQ